MAESTLPKTEDTLPAVMKAAQQSGYGEARNVLTLKEDIPVPKQLSSNQILVRVHAASINPIDWKLLDGNMSLIKRYSFPHTPGGDMAGVVVAVGSAVSRFKVGDQVYGNTNGEGGAYAEYLRANQTQFALKPGNLNMVEAAGIPLACETSYQALFKKPSPPVGSGSKVFVCGGATATGLYAIQLAKAAGAHVAITSSPRNFGLLEKLGYQLVHTPEEVQDESRQLLVIDYTAQKFAEVLRGRDYDVVYDCVGGEEQWLGAQQILKRGGCFVTIAGDDPEVSLSVKTAFTHGSRILSRKLGSVFGSAHHSYIFHLLSPAYQELDDLRTNYVEPGKLKAFVDTVFDWQSEGAEAIYKLYEKSKSGKAQGKLILKIADEQ